MKGKKYEISLNYKIERSNTLNLLTPSGWTLTEIRFLAIYQSKINARNPDTRVVMFPLDRFCEIMELKRLHITNMKETVKSLLCKPVFIPNDRNGFIGIPLFVECEVLQDEKTNEWFVKTECHPKALPYMFQMKKNYFTYELWNALRLSSVNQVRMYEILKQYEKIGKRSIEIDELKRMLGIKVTQYARYQDFRIKVLEACNRALSEHTDISFTYKPIKSGKKIYKLEFRIIKNKNFKDNLKLKEFINPEDLSDIADIEPLNEVIQAPEPTEQEVRSHQRVESIRKDSPLEQLYYMCNQRYTVEELMDLETYIKGSGLRINGSIEEYIFSVYHDIKDRRIKLWYKYTMSVIKKRVNEQFFGQGASTANTNKPKHYQTCDDPDYQANNVVSNKDPNANFDLQEYRTFIHSTKRIMHD